MDSLQQQQMLRLHKALRCKPQRLFKRNLLLWPKLGLRNKPLRQHFKTCIHRPQLAHLQSAALCLHRLLPTGISMRELKAEDALSQAEPYIARLDTAITIPALPAPPTLGTLLSK